jgi:hypothetical protein
MKIRLLFPLLLLGPSLFGQQTWNLLSEEGDTVRFAKIIVLNSSYWTSSDQNGQFSMDLSEIGEDQFFNVSATGFFEMTFSYKDLEKASTLYLKPQLFDLEEFVLTSKRLKFNRVGDKDLPLENKSEKSPTQNKQRNDVMRYASYFQLKGNKPKVISKISFYLSENGDKELEFVLRVLVSDEVDKPKEGIIYKVGQFRDIYKEPKVFSTSDYGWTEIDLEDKEITVPGQYKGAFLIFDVIKPKNSDRGQHMVIPFQDGSSEKQYAGFYLPSGIMGIYNKNRDHFAVVLDYLTE